MHQHVFNHGGKDSDDKKENRPRAEIKQIAGRPTDLSPENPGQVRTQRRLVAHRALQASMDSFVNEAHNRKTVKNMEDAAGAAQFPPTSRRKMVSITDLQTDDFK